MRIADILRKFADIVDQAEQSDSVTGQLSPLSKGDDKNRFDQVSELMPKSACDSEYANEPREEYADIDAVTVKAGGGINGPKHPHDIRVKDPSQHPGQQEY